MGIALAHLAPPSLVVADGQEDLPSLPVLCAHSFILGLQGPNLLSLMEFELNPSQVVPSSSLTPGRCQPSPCAQYTVTVLALPPGGECLLLY